MYRILLVDDEPLILAGIGSMVDWEQYGCVIVDTARNGEQALQKVKQLSPDIVITDIKMPAMTGIEFMEECRRQGYETEFLLLTNLEEFSLVKKAIRLGALDYIVKTEITPETMAESLTKAVAACKRRQKIQVQATAESSMQKSRKEIVRDLFRQILEKQKEEKEDRKEIWQREAESLQIDKIYECFVLFWIRPYKIYPYENGEELFKKTEEADRKERLEYAENLLEQFFDRNGKEYCLIQWEGKGFLIVLPHGGPMEICKNMAEKIEHIFQDYLGCSVLVAMSQNFTGVVDSLKIALRQVKELEKYYYYHSDGSVLCAEGFSGEEEHSRHDIFDISFLKKDLQQALVQRDREKVKQVFKEVTELFLEYQPAKEQIINACMNFYYFFFSYADGDKRGTDKDFPYPSEIVERLWECFTLQENVEWLEQLGDWIGKMLDTFRQTSKTEKIVDAVKNYVQENYKEKLTLTAISSAIGISQGYLSSVFKKQTGDNLTDYINKVKIEKAGELVDLHQYMMYEISDMLGFENPYYFSKVFKKITGLTPREYEMRNPKDHTPI